VYLTQALHRALQQVPERIAVVDGARAYTYRELADRVRRLAGGLSDLGVARGDRVGVLATNCAEYMEYTLGCQWLGAIASPMNNRWSTSELAYQIEDAGIETLLADRPRLQSALELQHRHSSLRTVIGIGGGDLPTGVVDYEQLISKSDPVDDVRVGAGEVTLLMYTGGTTGLPKGVMLGGRQLITSALGSQAAVGLPGPERHLHVGPLFHLAAFAAMNQHLMQHSTHIMMGDFDVARMALTIQDQGVTSVTLVPTMVQWLLDYSDSAGVDISSLRVLSYGAAPMPEAVIRRLAAKLPKVFLRQAYGMTELGPVATVLTDQDHRDPDHAERIRSVGRAAPHCELKIVDRDDTELPAGSIGEIVVRGEHVMAGYWNKPAETAEALRQGWMHTGDAGYLDSHGYLYLVDRIKDMIVSGGENVYSAEVEKVIYQHPAVASCAVIGVRDDVWGERVHAVVVLKPDHSLTAEEVRNFVGDRIARYKAPRSVAFTDALPVSAVGKILKRVLREEYQG
jgi:acyl-CoA synthetase (AMP-forming)/AMP-acid ligase II